MGLRNLVVGVASLAAASAAQDAFERQMRNLVSVADMISQLPENITEIQVETGEAPEPPLDDTIGNYLRIRDWQNPIVTILSTGVEVRSGSLADGALRAPIGALRCILSNLPMSAWPHGRVVRAGNSSLIGAFADMGAIRRNNESAQTVLDELQVLVLWFPN